MKLSGKTVLVTGASSGIGKAFSLRAAKDGATVFLASRKVKDLESVKKEVESLGGVGIVVKTDVTKSKDIKNLFEKIKRNRKPLDVVFDNAGLGFVDEVVNLTDEQIELMMDVNAKGMILVAKYAAQIMREQKSGHLVMTSSMAGLVALQEWSVYVASKWAITGFANSIRGELKPYNVKVTSLHPGLVKTGFFDKDKADLNLDELTQQSEAIEPTDVADAVYDALFTDQKKIIIPKMAQSYSLLYRYLPGLTEKLIEKMAEMSEK